jgi:hypothetical protein
MMNYIVSKNLPAALEKKNKGNQCRRISSTKEHFSGTRGRGQALTHRAEMMLLAGENALR